MPVHEAEESRTVLLTIPAKPEYIALGRLALTGLGRVRDLPDETIGDLKLALTEACTNSVRHAYRERDGAGEVAIRYELHADRLVVEVSDDGTGLSPAEVELDGNGDLSEGGLGIAIIRALTDELELTSDGEGVRLRFVKQLPAP